MKNPSFLIILRIIVFFGFFTLFVNAQNSSQRSYGKGHPFQVEQLPAGKLKTQLQSLDPQAKDKAMKWLHELTFLEFDAAEHLRVDKDGGVFIVCPDGHGNCDGRSHKAVKPGTNKVGEMIVPIETQNIEPTTSTATEPEIAAAAVSISSPPAYNSKPGAPYHIYLDFNGAYVTGKAWSSTDGTTTWTTWDCDSWGTDADKTTFSDSEQAEMRRVWERISEDYAPYNVNVTTDVTYDSVTYTGDKNKVGWLLFTATTDKTGARCPHYGSGGVAYVNVYGNSNFFSTYQPAWVTPTGSANMAEAAAHEMGHNLGLSHDGTSVGGLAYYGGHAATTSAPSWGPIMGTGYNRNVSQWSKASEYYDGNQTQDDLTIIANKLTYRTDDHGDTFGTATAWLSGSVNQKGVVERTDNSDVFTFNTGAGSISFSANTYRCDTGTWGANLDVILELYNDSQVLVASSNPAAEVNATITYTAPAGRYYLVLKPSAAGSPLISPPSGYTIYASLGQYTVTGNFIPEDGILLSSPGGGESWIVGATYNITWGSAMGGNVKIELLKNGSLNSTIISSTPNDGSYTWTIPSGQTVASDYKVRITSVETPTKTDQSLSNFSITTDPLGAALDTVGLAWTTSGNLPWFAQTTTTKDGIDAARSGAIADAQSSSMETTIVGPGTMTFWWKVSSESSYDFLRFYLNGVEQTGSLAKISGTVDWIQKTVTIPTGSNVVKWSYTKDANTIAGSDAAWVDQVVFTSTDAPEIAVEQPLNTGLTDGSSTINFGSVNTGSSTQLTFTIKNVGTADLTSLALSKSGTHSADYTLGSLGATTVAAGSSTTFTVTFAPGATGTRTAAIQIASNDGDENPFDINLTGSGVGTGSLAVTPEDNLSATGLAGGPFSPSSIVYTLSNPGSSSISWTAGKTQGWVTLSSASGTLAAGASTTVTASINSNANSLAVGSYSDTVTFTNTTNASGNTTRAVTLNVNPAPVTVTFDANGGATPSPTSKEVTNGTAYGTLATVTRTGHTFNGWFTATSGGVLVTAATTVSATTNHTLYAQWTVNTYTVSYDANQASGGSAPGNQTKTHDVNLTLATNSGALSRVGYTFSGWNTSADGSGTNYATGATYTANASVTLFARWTGNSYTCSFDANGGEAPVPTSKTVIYGSTYDALPTTQRTGYLFNGWFTAAAGGTQVTAELTVEIAANHTLYAQWTILFVEMNVLRNAAPIAVGGYDPLAGTAAATGAKLNYGIVNAGNTNLTLGSAVIAGMSNCSVTIDSQPSASVPPSELTSLVLTVTPSASGAWSFTVTIPNNDPDENPYQWTAHGVAAISTTATLVSVADTYIYANSAANNYGGATSLSLFNRSQQSNFRYGLLRFDLSTIPANATITSASVGLVQSNANSGPVNIVEMTGDWTEGAATWTSSSALVGTTSFGVESAPGTIGASLPSIVLNATGTATVQSWLTSTNPNYGFGVKTTNSAANSNIDLYTRESIDANRPRLAIAYTVNPQIAEMDVTRGVSAVADGGADNVASSVASSGTPLTYTIASLGNVNLTLTTPVSVSSVSNCAVVINNQPANTVASSTSTSLIVTVTPTASGAWSANISIASNDPDEAPYNWTISGTAVSMYSSWTSRSFVNAFTDTANTSNPDGDTLTNLQEFAFGTDPTTSMTSPISFVTNGDITNPGTPILMDFDPAVSTTEYRAVFGRRKDYLTAGLAYTVQFSANLSYWEISGIAPTVLTGVNGSEIEAVSIPFPTTVPLSSGGPTAPPKFFRVGVVGN